VPSLRTTCLVSGVSGRLPSGFPGATPPAPNASKGAQSTEHWMLIGKWDRGAYQFSGRGPLFPESFA
jgi:hypothetical protein